MRTKPEDVSIEFVDADAWRSYIPGPWILDVLRTSQPRPDQLALLDRFRHQTDTIADDLVAAMRRRKGGGRAQFEQAIEHGLHTVENPMPELVAYMAAIEERPYWVDDKLLATAQAALTRVPVPLLMALIGSVGLPSTYASYRANAVLVLAGDLENKAASRTVETTGWMIESALPGGLERDAAGFKSSARVRLMHAQIRAGIAKLDRWDHATLGTPVNQLQQSFVLSNFAGGLSILGLLMFSFTPREMRGVFHLYRYLGYLLGVPAELEITGFKDLFRMVVMIQDVELGMDEYGRRLTVALHDALPALLGVPTTGPLAGVRQKATRQFYSDLTRILLGGRYSDAAGVAERSPLAAAVPVWIAASHLRNDVRALRFLGRPGQRLASDAEARSRELEVFNKRVHADRTFLRDEASAAIARNAAEKAAS